MLKYRLEETEEIKQLLVRFEALRIVFGTLKQWPATENNLRRESLLKSSVFSARIEGNPLSLERARMLAVSALPEETSKLEVFNLLKAYRYLYCEKIPKKLSLKLILRFHKIVMNGLSGDIGRLRKEPWGIFNQAGIAVYLAPPPFKLTSLMDELIKLDRTIDCSVPIRAGLVGFLFEKIHPLADGNGRVGRLISAFILKTGGHDFRGLLSFEEYIDEHREEYYRTLEPTQNATSFVFFFLEAIIFQAEKMAAKLGQITNETPEDGLLPRRREILEITRDHPYSSFDFLRRRFPAVNPKTLHYDLKKLQDERYIIKAGKTKGVFYKAKQ